MIIDSKKSLVAFAITACLVALAGCADKGNPDNVDRRSVERWNDLIAHDADKAYDYLSPGYRATQSRKAYAGAMNNRPVRWKSAKFKSKKCDTDRCAVQVDVSYSVMLPNAGEVKAASSVQSETWIRVNGQWYFLPK